MDRMVGGSWLGLNDQGVIAAVMNRSGTLGPQTGKRSRGELVLKALAYDSSTVAATALTDLDPSLYQSFNLVVADRRTACWLCHRGEKPSTRIEVHALPSTRRMDLQPVWLFAAGRPDLAAYESVPL